MISEITEALFSEPPAETLYHYTSLSGVLGIIGSRTLWASDIRYMNDSAELRHTADLVEREVVERINAGHNRPNLLTSFLDWVKNRITNGHILFGASFRANGNLLSQWRGYSAVGKGASLGFNPQTVSRCAAQQQFRLGRCIYDRSAQQGLIAKVVDAVEVLSKDVDDGVANEVYHQLFEHLESDLLRLAAILKHPSFEEEQEWRLVSPVIPDYRQAAVNFREGRSMLVPYISFSLLPADSEVMDLDHVFLGPTPNISLSMNSMKMCLAKHSIRPTRGIEYCQIPYRQN
jgi:hypothetical protein